MLLPPPANLIRLVGLALVLAFVVVGVPASQHAAGATPEPAAWSWPLTPPHPIARPFVAPPTPYSAGHRGIDVTAAPGADILAPAGGVVHFSGVVVDRPVLSIRHPGGLISSFEPVASPLQAGDAVSGGQLVGTLEAGHCATACLHFGVRLHGEYVSPLNYLGGAARAVLLPTRSLD
jgi:murein DD-endopeptidase MepM/ murein hydrolase activator NlpD